MNTCVLHLYGLTKDPTSSQTFESALVGAQTKEGQTCSVLKIDLVEFKLRTKRGAMTQSME